jgi:cob(I)alamin adenosyltransferase
MIFVFTGNGKGKTTAALGQAMRALGQDKRVLMIQFIKGPWKSGENYFADKFQIPNSEFRIIPAGKGFVKILGDKLLLSEHKKAGQKALKLARAAIQSKKWDLIILDEINVAVDLKLIRAGDVLKILKFVRSSSGHSDEFAVSDRVDVILTGRNAPKSFIKAADLVTEMKEVKHPFRRGKLAKRGIDF